MRFGFLHLQGVGMDRCQMFHISVFQRSGDGC